MRKLFESGGVGVPSTRNVKKNRRIRDENKNRSHPCHIRSFRFRPELPGWRDTSNVALAWRLSLKMRGHQAPEEGTAII